MLSRDTLSCHDHHLYQIIFRSHDAGRSYVSGAILEDTDTHTQTHEQIAPCALPPFYGRGHKNGKHFFHTNIIKVYTTDIAFIRSIILHVTCDLNIIFFPSIIELYCRSYRAHRLLFTDEKTYLKANSSRDISHNKHQIQYEHGIKK